MLSNVNAVKAAATNASPKEDLRRRHLSSLRNADVIDPDSVIVILLLAADQAEAGCSELIKILLHVTWNLFTESMETHAYHVGT